jgi:hypothetical protein
VQAVLNRVPAEVKGMGYPHHNRGEDWLFVGAPGLTPVYTIVDPIARRVQEHGGSAVKPPRMGAEKG